MNILSQIINQKIKLKDEGKLIKIHNTRNVKTNLQSLKTKLINAKNPQIIAEFKRKSPSKGLLNIKPNLKKIVETYYQYNATAVSIITDEDFFNGSILDLELVSNFPIPFLRKDFIIFEEQIQEAYNAGASVILLIAANLTTTRTKELAQFAHHLGLEVLLEVHGSNELAHLNENIDILGINNRDLTNFTVSIETTLKILPQIDLNIPIISESGINNIETIKTLYDAGCKGFLMGEYFMASPDPSETFIQFMAKINALQW